MAQINTDIHFLTILSDSYFNEIFQMHPKIENSANPKEFSAFKIYYYLKNIKPSKTPVPDAISGHVLKNCASSLSFPLIFLYNMAYQQGTLPQDWKM